MSITGAQLLSLQCFPCFQSLHPGCAVGTTFGGRGVPGLLPTFDRRAWRRGHKKSQVIGSVVQGHWVRGCRSPGQRPPGCWGTWPQWSSWAHAGWADVCPSQAGALGVGGGGGGGGGLRRTRRQTCVRPGALRPPEEGSDHSRVSGQWCEGRRGGAGGSWEWGPPAGEGLKGQRRPC